MSNVKIDIINGPEGPCLAINDTRVAGPKPWGGGRVALSTTVPLSSVQKALGGDAGENTITITPGDGGVWLLPKRGEPTWLTPEQARAVGQAGSAHADG